MSETISIEDLADNVQFDVPPKEAPKVDTNALAIRSDITKVSDVMTEFEKISAGLDDLAARYPIDLVYDVTTSTGMAEAKEHRAAWRDPRQAIERMRKQAKAPVIALGKNIDARAEWITAQLELGEKPIDAQIKAEEKRKEDEKKARELAETDRVMKIEDAIGEIHMAVMIAASKSSTFIAAEIEALRTAVLDPLIYQDRMGQAEAARTAAVAKLEVAIKAKLHDEAEAKKLADERAELATLRAAEATRKANEEAAALVEKNRIAAEQAETARLNKIAADQIAAQQAEINRQREKLEADQRAADDRETARLQEVERLAQVEADRVRATAEPIEPAPAPAPAVAPAPAEIPAVETTAAAVEPATDDTRAPINTGTVCTRMKMTLTSDFIRSLGIESLSMPGRAGTYWAESSFPTICDAVIAHVVAVKAAAKAVAV